jgi:hypothetical protein
MYVGTIVTIFKMGEEDKKAAEWVATAEKAEKAFGWFYPSKWYIYHTI